MDELYIDVGYDSKDQLAELVGIGDLATINRKVVNLNGSLMAGKAMDDRAGVAVMLECLKALANMNHIADVYAVATVQEEVGVGATTSTYGIVPDIGIALDVGHGDMPGWLSILPSALATDLALPWGHTYTPVSTSAWCRLPRTGTSAILWSQQYGGRH